MNITLSRFYKQNPFDFTFHQDRFFEFVAVAKKLKFDGITYMATIPELFSSFEKIPLLTSKYDVKILGIHAPAHLLFYTPEFSFKKLCAMNTTFPDCEVINFHMSGFINPINRSDTFFKKFVNLTQENNVPISIESNPKMFGLHYYPKVTWDPDLFAHYCIESGLPITFDTSHIAHWKYNIVTFFKKYHKHIKLIHLSDSIGIKQHLPLGEGNLPIKELLQEIKRVKYKQQITFEMNNFPKGATKEEKIEALQKSLTLVKQYAF